MATIKSFTDISQSKKLAEILPLESADMTYICIDICKGLKYMPEPRFIGNIPDHADEYDVNAWSLASLLGVLPQGEYKDTDLCFGGYEGDKYIPEWFCSYEQQEPFILEICHADNPVDACVAMVEKLHELKML